MDGRICTLSLLFLVVSGVGSLRVNIPEELYEYARGDNITLPCTFSSKVTSPKLVVISWSAQEAEDTVPETLMLTYYSAGEVLDIKQQYEGRVSLDVDINSGKANLKLSKITLADNKMFECRVQIPGDDEGQPADTTQLVVLVAPSTPICKIEGKAEYGQNINLTCKSEEGSPPPTYKWENRDVRNMPRANDPRTTDKGGILSLYNISKDTSGYFTCTSSNKIRSASCNITLSVMPPSMNLGSVGGIIGIVVGIVGLLLLIIIIYCCCCRKKNKEDEYAMGIREEEFHDKEPARNGESRQADGQDNLQSDESRRDRYEERRERDYDDRRSDYDDRRSDYNDRRSDYDDRRSDYNDRRSDYDDRRSDYDDRRSDYSDRRDRHERYDDDDRRRDDDQDRRRDDDRDRRRDDDRRRYDDNDRYDEPYDDRRPPVPANKPRRDYDED